MIFERHPMLLQTGVEALKKVCNLLLGLSVRVATFVNDENYRYSECS
jgi:hypothetical protein